MKVLIKQLYCLTNETKFIGSFHITQDEFLSFFLSKKGKKVLKEIAPPELKINHPSIIPFLTMLYQMNSSALPPGIERDFWIYDIPVKNGKSLTKTFLEKYLPQQLSITYKKK